MPVEYPKRVPSSLPGRLAPLGERVGAGPKTVIEQPKVGLSSWDTTQRMLFLTFSNDKAKLRFMRKHINILHAKYNALYQRASLKPGEIIPAEEDKSAEFDNTYVNPNSPMYSKRMLEKLQPMIAVVEGRFPQLEDQVHL